MAKAKGEHNSQLKFFITQTFLVGILLGKSSITRLRMIKFEK